MKNAKSDIDFARAQSEFAGDGRADRRDPEVPEEVEACTDVPLPTVERGVPAGS